MMDVRKNKRRVKICVLSMGGYKDGERNTHIQKRESTVHFTRNRCVCVCVEKGKPGHKSVQFNE
jgi:predicted acyl esterase